MSRRLVILSVVLTPLLAALVLVSIVVDRVTALEEQVRDLRDATRALETDAPPADQGVAADPPAPSVQPAADYPPPATESRVANFLVKCGFSHRAQVDPIVRPGPSGTPSDHAHDFFGNTSTDSSSTLTSMLLATTTCSVAGDTAAYWSPTLLDADGEPYEPTHMFSYYRNTPAGYGSTVPFPPDFRMIAGGEAAFPEHVWWNCHDDDSEVVRYEEPPACTDSALNAVIIFPNCWDGVNLDSPDHRSHVVYPEGAGRTACPESHPVKVPNVRYAIQYPEPAGGPGWVLSDGTALPHADFWNTWDQVELEVLLDECTRVRKCGILKE